MKKFNRLFKSHATKQIVSITQATVLLTGWVVTTCFLTGCANDDDPTITSFNTDFTTYRTTQAYTHPNRSSYADMIAELNENKARLTQEQLENTHARLAAKHNHICPKLVMTEVDLNSITRVGEVLTSRYCEYYIYPEVGKHLMVVSQPDELELLLVVPTIHNFANGDYIVKDFDKHIIRVEYKDAATLSKPLEYDIQIIVN